MNAAKFTLTSTILAAALGLVMGLGAAPAQAHGDEVNCLHNNNPDHKHCLSPDDGTGGGGEADTIFDVVLESLRVVPPGPNPVIVIVGPCEGDTDILANPGLTVNFDPLLSGCTVQMTTDRTAPDDEVTMYLFRLEVKTKGSGDTEIVLNFTTVPDSVAGANLWVTDKLTAMVEPGPGDGELVLMPTAGIPELLTKGHQPDRGAETMEGLLIGEFTYMPRLP